MKNLRRRFDRFCFQNRSKGIPNLMLYISLGSGLVYLMSEIAGNSTLYYLLMYADCHFPAVLLLHRQSNGKSVGYFAV